MIKIAAALGYTSLCFSNQMIQIKFEDSLKIL